MDSVYKFRLSLAVEQAITILSVPFVNLKNLFCFHHKLPLRARYKAVQGDRDPARFVELSRPVIWSARSFVPLDELV
jgi:hypothetical protein